MSSYEQYFNAQKNLASMGMNINASVVSQNLVNTLKQALNPQTVKAYADLVNSKVREAMSVDEQRFVDQMTFYVTKAKEIGMSMKNGLLDLSNMEEVLAKVSAELLPY